MIIYYIPVFVTLASNFIYLLNNKKFEFVSIIMITLLISIISGMRLYSDIDFDGYIELYKNTPIIGVFSLDTVKHLYGEIGYLFVTSIIKSIGGEFVVVTLLFSLLSISLKSFFFYKLSSNACIALSLYLCISFITVEFITLRWSIASSLIVIAYYHLYKENFIYTFIFLSISMLFHYFSIAFVILLFLKKINSIRLIKLSFFLAFLVGLILKLGGQTINLAYNSDFYLIQTLIRYLNNPDSNVGFFSYLKAFLIPLLYLIYDGFRLKRTRHLPDPKVIYLAKWMFVFTSFAFLFASIPIFFFRISVISDIFSIALIINIIRFEKSMLIRHLLIFLLSSVFIAWCFLDVNNNISGLRLYEYTTWWSKVA